MPHRRPISELRIPHSLQVAVQQRLGRLSAAREVITIAAVAGRRFDFDLLRELTGPPDLAYVAALFGRYGMEILPPPEA
jgi:predicted ATPase